MIETTDHKTNTTMSESTANFAEELQMKSMVKLIDQLTNERDELKQKLDEENLNRLGCEYAMTELRRCCGLDMSKIDLREVKLHIDGIVKERDQLAAKCASLSTDIHSQDQTIFKLSAKLAELNNTANEAWNALDNGKRKHHTDPLNGGCILGCQACAVDKLKHALSDQCGKDWLSPEKKKELEEQHCMEMAAVMTATVQNTESTVKDRIGRDNPYWTQAYADVCTAIDREMVLLNKKKVLVEALERCMTRLDGTHHNQTLKQAQQALEACK